jgi:hypothetical protein
MDERLRNLSRREYLWGRLAFWSISELSASVHPEKIV